MIREEFRTKTEADKHLKGKPGFGQNGQLKKFQENRIVPSYTDSTTSQRLRMHVSTLYSAESK